MPRRLLVLTALAALCLPAAVGLASVPAGRYTGKTADRRPVSFRVSGTSVRAFSFQTRFRCNSRAGFVARARFANVRLHGTRFNITFASPDRAIRTTVRGVFHGRQASGTITRRASFNAKRRLDPAGKLICRSSTRWTARR